MAQLIDLQRRLAAILVADIVGYSRLMEEDEESTFSWQRRAAMQRSRSASGRSGSSPDNSDRR